jgi:hypothetical protein
LSLLACFYVAFGVFCTCVEWIALAFLSHPTQRHVAYALFCWPTTPFFYAYRYCQHQRQANALVCSSKHVDNAPPKQYYYYVNVLNDDKMDELV